MTNESFDELLDEFSDIDRFSTAEKAPTPQANRRPSLAQRQSRLNAEGTRLSKDTNYLSYAGVVTLEPEQELEWKLSGVQPEVFRELQSGSYDIRDQLDLHHKTVDEARKLVWNFIGTSMKNDFRCVRIIHGTGKLSDPPAQLKSHVAHWLQEHKHVLAYASAPKHMGGVGAVLVKLRKSHRAKETNRENFGLKSG